MTEIVINITLEEAEEIIQNGLDTFIDVGSALITIRDNKLYKKGYKTFEEYLDKRWNMSKKHAYRLIDSTNVVGNLKSVQLDTLPINEAQTRPLARLAPTEQVEAWQRVIESAPPSGITAKLVLAAAKEIQQEKREQRRNERIEKLVEITENNKPLEGIGIFPVIYADPPWQYEHPISDSRRIENQYPTMTIEDICNLPVNDIATDDAVIFLWATTPMLKKGFQVLDAWGFEYRTCMVWVKPSIGPGHWVRNRHELLLIGVKGNIPTPKGEDKPDSVIEAPRQEHSKKPEIVYDIIEKMYPELEKVELFCRQPRQGWKAWGNQS